MAQEKQQIGYVKVSKQVYDDFIIKLDKANVENMSLKKSIGGYKTHLKKKDISLKYLKSVLTTQIHINYYNIDRLELEIQKAKNNASFWMWAASFVTAIWLGFIVLSIIFK